jgi:hypothetical protein
MVIPQFGTIIRLLRYRWFYKLELLVVYSITVFFVPCSHFQILGVLLDVVHSSYQYFFKFFVGLPSGAPSWVKGYHMEYHYHTSVLSWWFQGWVILKQKENLWKMMWERIQEVFKKQIFFFVHMEARWDRFHLENQNDMLFHFKGGKQNPRGFLVHSKPRVSILQATLCSDTIL